MNGAADCLWKQTSSYHNCACLGGLSGDVTASACMLALQVARTSAGVIVSSRFSGHESEADEEDADPCLEVENLLCVTVDACGRSTRGFVNAHFRYSRAAPASDDDDAEDYLEDGSDDDPETHSLEVVPSAQCLRQHPFAAQQS